MTLRGRAVREAAHWPRGVAIFPRLPISCILRTRRVSRGRHHPLSRLKARVPDWATSVRCPVFRSWLPASELAFAERATSNFGF